MRIASYPDRNPGNPSIELFYKALGEYGVQLVGRLEVDCSWLETRRSQLDAVYMHWPERIWRGRMRGRLDRLRDSVTFGRLRRLAALRRFLKTAQRLGMMRIWTVHNLEHHEGTGWADRVGYRILATHSDLLVCYSDSAAKAIRERYGNRRVLVMRRGNYGGVFPSPRPRHAVITELGLKPQLPIVCCVGLIRQYKGIDTACAAIRRLVGRVQLVVGGLPWAEEDLHAVQRAMDGLQGAVLVARTLTDQEFADIVAASDAVLLPYRKITGSGLLFAAWTLGRGVVASDLPFFREMIPACSVSGLLVSSNDPAALADGIMRYLAIPAERRSQAALEESERHSWTRCVEPLAQALLEWRREAVRRPEGMPA
jgi:beta-1,4-mannosyltransferase